MRWGTEDGAGRASRMLEEFINLDSRATQQRVAAIDSP
jgi:hypothetical protein